AERRRGTITWRQATRLGPTSPPKSTAPKTRVSAASAGCSHAGGGSGMKRSKFSEEQVAYALRQAETGTAGGDVCRQLGISEATFYVWKKRYGHLGVHEVRRVRQLEGRECAVEAPGRRSHSRQAHAGGGPPAQKLTPTRRRELARWFLGTFQIPIRRACGLAQLSRTAWYRP